MARRHPLLRRFVPSALALGCALAISPVSSAAQVRTRSWVQLLAPALEGQININEATAEQLILLPGVGPATAAKIVEYREHRLFHRPVHLMRVKGIGKKTFQRLRPYVTVEGPTTLHVVPQAT